MIWKMIGGFIGTMAAKILAYFAIKRAGANEQAAKDRGAILDAANERAKVDNRVGGISSDALRDGLLGDSPDTER